MSLDRPAEGFGKTRNRLLRVLDCGGQFLAHSSRRAAWAATTGTD
jgi:hypothetical protein